MSQADRLYTSRRVARPGRRWHIVGLSFAATLSLLSLFVLVPAGVRALPGRYAARLPAFLQDLRHRPHPDLLPTPAHAANPFLGKPTIAVTIISEPANTPTAMAMTSLAAAPTNTPVVSASNTLVASATKTPTASPTNTPTATPMPTPQLPISATLPPITHTRQTWNNCGPATISMALLYFGQFGDQADAASFLKPDPEDKNVSPHELAAYAQSLGLSTQLRVGGDLARLKRLIAAGFPVVVETWFIPEPGDQMGHYRLLTGYDDNARHFIAQDSYNGPNVRLNYDALDELWRVFNRVYLVVYEPAQESELVAILGAELDDQVMYTRALETAQEEVINPSTECVAYEDCADSTAFSWFNVGTSLNAVGQHQDAAAAYDQARLLGLPWRMLWYQFGPYETYYAAGRFDDVITLATATLNVVDNLEESHYWRGMAFLAQGNAGRARADFEAAVKYNPNFSPASEALESLQ